MWDRETWQWRRGLNRHLKEDQGDLRGGSLGEKDGASRYLAMNHADWRRARARVPSFSSSSFFFFFFFFFIITRSNWRRERFISETRRPIHTLTPSIGHSMTRLDVSFLHYSPKIFLERSPLRDATSSFPIPPRVESTCGAEFPPAF